MQILGQHKVAVLDDCRFWAERGLVHCEDGRDNTYKTIPIIEALHRVNAISEMIGNSTSKDEDPQRRAVLQNFVDRFVDVIRQAREQGSPDDPTFKPAKKTQILVSTSVPYF